MSPGFSPGTFAHETLCTTSGWQMNSCRRVLAVDGRNLGLFGIIGMAEDAEESVFRERACRPAILLL